MATLSIFDDHLLDTLINGSRDSGEAAQNEPQNNHGGKEDTAGRRHSEDIMVHPQSTFASLHPSSPSRQAMFSLLASTLESKSATKQTAAQRSTQLFPR